MDESSYSSFNNLALQPIIYRSSVAEGQSNDSIKQKADHSIGQFPRLGCFGSVTSLAISKNEKRDLLDFVFFLANHNVKLSSVDDIAKDGPHTTGFQGTSMEVFPGTWQGRKVALKYLRKTKLPDPSWKESNPPEYRRLLQLHQARQKDIMFEIKVMARGHFSQHPNIVKLFAVFFEDDEVLPGEANIYSPGMIVELADHETPDLEAYLQSQYRPSPISFETAAGIIADTADGLAALHSYGVIHADLKPSNVLLFTQVPGETRPVAKIADFGFCGIMSSDDTTRGGTSYWNAPENIAPSPQIQHGSYITEPLDFYRDIYSFGLVAAVTALDGNLPFAHDQATRLKLEDGVTEAFASRLEYQSTVSRYTTGQLDSFKTIAQGSLVRDQRHRFTTLTCIRPILFQGEVPLIHGTTAEIVPFSLLESLTHGDDTRYSRGWQYPKTISQYAQIPQSIINKLDESLNSVDLETAPPPVVAQCFFWAEARINHTDTRQAYLEMSRVIFSAAEKMKKHASINQPDFVSVPQAMIDSSNRGLETDLILFHAQSGVEHTILRSIQASNLEHVKALLTEDSTASGAVIGPNWGCLHFAAHYDRASIIELILHAGIDIDTPAGENSDTTPLAVAAREANLKSTRELLRLGASVDPPFTGIYRIPLREAIMFSNDSKAYVDTVEALLLAGASLGHAGFGTAAVHNATHLPNTLEVMLKYDPNSVNYRDMARATPLHHAVKRRSKRSVQILLKHGANIKSVDECGFTPLHSACRMLSPKKFDFHGAELEEFIKGLAVGTPEDGEEIIQMLRDSGAEIDMPLFDGLYGPASTPDSFLYDTNIDISEITIPFSQFAHTADSEGPPLSERFVPIPIVGEDCPDGTIYPSMLSSSVMVSAPRNGSSRHQYILRDVLPNSYELIICIGMIDGDTYLPPANLSFQMHAEASHFLPETNLVSVIMGGYLKPLPRLCPKSEHMYTVKMQEFETYARRDIRIEAVIIAPELDALIGGLLIKWVRIQRCNVERDEFSIISGNALQPSELEQVASALHGSGCMDSLRV